LNGSNTGTNSPTYTNSSLQNDDQITCTVYSSLTCATNSPVTSSPLDILITPQTALDASISGDIYLCTSETATFTADIIEDGTSPVYDWLVNSVSQGVNSTTFQSSTLNNDDVVSFVITSPGSCISNSPAEFTITVYVDDAPVADFTYVPDGLTFTFTSTYATGNHLWQFGDGNESSDVNPIYTYAAAGMYIITHYVSNYCDTISVMQSVNAIDVNAEMTETEMLINIFPNPVQGTLSINTSSSFAGKVEFTDVSGRIVYVKDLQYDIRHSVDMKQIEGGIYFLNLYDLNGNQVGSSAKIINQ
jgi:PKD repeat protein